MRHIPPVGHFEGLGRLHRGHKLVVQLRQAVVVHTGALVVQAKACGERPSAQPEDRLVEKSRIPGPGEKARVNGHLLVRNGQVADVGGNIFVGIVQDKLLDAHPFKVDGGFLPVELVEGEKARYRLPDGVLFFSAGQHFRGGRPAHLCLLQGKDRPGRVVLVHSHIIGEQLQGSGSFQLKERQLLLHPEAFDHR